ncbi:thioesterase domain-containing protein [Nocardia sp. NPDC087230]|uniref:thioesterase domain-containing protein n=1 Tax=Nocardia sp. NPDC087230 TaxID=3364331 RepID=UPI003809579D
MSSPADPFGTRPGCVWAPDEPESCPAVPIFDDRRAGASALASMVPIRPLGPHVDGAPLFCLAGEAGLAWSYAGLLDHLDPRVPVYGIQAPVTTAAPRTVRESATRAVAEIRGIAPHGPYQLLGWSAGGFVAHEIAVLLRAAGEHVDVVVLHADPAACEAVPPPRATAGEFVYRFGPLLAVEADTAGLSPEETAAVLVRALAGTVELTGADLDRLTEAADAAARMVAGHHPSVLTGDLIVGVAGREPDGTARPTPEAVVRNWHRYVEGAVTGFVLDATPDELTAPDLLPDLARVLATAAAAGRTAC